MRYQKVRYARVEQFYADDSTDWEFDLLQLSPGQLNFTSSQVCLEGIRLDWNQFGARIRSREVYHGPGIIFGYVLNSSSCVKLCGHELDQGYAAVWQSGQELEYIAPAGITSLVIYVDKTLADLLGWNLADDRFRKVPISRLLALEKTCRLATFAAQNKMDNAGDMSASLSLDTVLWRERILAKLEAALEPWLRATVSAPDALLRQHSHFRLIKDTEYLFEQNNLDHPVAMDTIADKLGVPRRTLFHAFRNWLELGPHTYLQLVRLHRLRDRLLAGTPTDTSVTQLAIELGFRHLGRLSAAYHDHFGEYPRDTLRRN
ncbi:MAG TPA: AraC family transcriptional regulator [Gammaproteobacteria bacterium]|nr:AraC family transcriptional regulator [Gammaproteobacteria bacterium]